MPTEHVVSPNSVARYPSEAKAGIGTAPADHKSGIGCGLNVRKSPLARKKSAAHSTASTNTSSDDLDALLRFAFYAIEISERYLSDIVEV
jgi:hypothetical protein